MHHGHRQRLIGIVDVIVYRRAIDGTQAAAAEFTHLHLDHRDVALGERRDCIQVAERRFLLDKAADERGRRHAFDAQLAEDAQVLWVVHASDAAVHLEHPQRDLACHKVVVVAPGCRHEHIGMPDIGIFHHARVAAVAEDNQHTAGKRGGHLDGAVVVRLDDHDIVAALERGAGQVFADLAGTHDDDVHVRPFSSAEG